MKIKEKVFITNSPLETKKLGRDFGRTLKKGDVIALYGDLGSGKTTFVQGLAEGLGIKKRIISPTFVIVRNYRIMNFYHIDLYRVKNGRGLEGLGLEEIMDDPQNIVVIEWAQNLKKLMPDKRIDIEFSYEKDHVRKVMFRS